MMVDGLGSTPHELQLAATRLALLGRDAARLREFDRELRKPGGDPAIKRRLWTAIQDARNAMRTASMRFLALHQSAIANPLLAARAREIEFAQVDAGEQNTPDGLSGLFLLAVPIVAAGTILALLKGIALLGGTVTTTVVALSTLTALMAAAVGLVAELNRSRQIVPIVQAGGQAVQQTGAGVFQAAGGLGLGAVLIAGALVLFLGRRRAA